MANVIQIKRGNGAPTSGTLADGELGFDKEHNILYIGNGNTIFAFDYLRKTGGTITGNLSINSDTNSVLYVHDGVSKGYLYIGFGSGHQNHGLYSNGYAPTSSTWTTDGKWMIYRNSSGDIILNGNANTASKATAANITTTANAIAYYTNTTGTFGTKASANGALYATSSNGTLNFGTLPVAQGGTGNTSLTSGELLVGAGTGALTTKAILQLSSRSSFNWNTTTANQHKIPDISCMAYWNGAYEGTNSNLVYCSTGSIIGSNGGTITGALAVNGSNGLSVGSSAASASGFKCRNISYGNTAPSSSSGNNGDIFLLYS